MKDNSIKEIVEPLLDWFSKKARVLPWRDNPSAYRVWVSEIMLQQTRVEAVKPYFERFIQVLPDVKSLACIPEEELLKLWEGLGYYNRVRNMQKAACIMVEKYGGSLPEDYNELLSLPGIGEYTAGAIASIAFGIPKPAVDGNVLRVFARLEENQGEINNPLVKREITGLVERLMPKPFAGAFNQALMELGAVVCLPNGIPLCEECPVRFYCGAYKNKTVMQYPKKAVKKERKVENRVVFLLICQDKIALRKRPAKGLLASLWEFPQEEGLLKGNYAEEMLSRWKLEAYHLEALPKSKHIFTHIEWHMEGICASVKDTRDEFRWVSAEELTESYAVPSAFRTYLGEALRRLK